MLMLIQEVGATADVGLMIQAAAAALLPVLIGGLRMIVPGLEGKTLFYVNMGLNVAVAIAVTMGLDVPAAAAITIGLGAGLAGSKAVDLKKRGVVLSRRYRK